MFAQPKISLLLLLSLAFSTFSFSQTYLKDKIPQDPSIRTGKLANGLHYFIQYNAKPEKRAELRLAVKTGSLHEDPDQLGVAHFVEHMAFNGTKNFPKNDLVKYLEGTGARFGPDLNAYTSFDETVYMLQSRTDSVEQFNKAMLILEDWAFGQVFDPQEVQKERGVVISEWRTRLNANQRMQQQYLPIIFRGLPHASRLPIGDPVIIDTIPPQRVADYYQKHYQPSSMAVMVVGDIDVDAVEKMIMNRFSGSKVSGVKPKPLTLTPDTKTYAPVVKTYTDPEAPFSQIDITYRQPGKRGNTIENLRASLVQSLYNTMLNARLVEIQQKADAPFTFASSSYSSFIDSLDAYNLSVFTSADKMEVALKTILEETYRVAQHGFLASELDRAKTEMLVRAERGVKEKDKRQSASLASALVNSFINAQSVRSPEQTLEWYKVLLADITLAELQKLAPAWLDTPDRIAIITAPEKEKSKLPQESVVLKLLEEAPKGKYTPYTETLDDSPIMEKPKTAATIRKETKNDVVGTTEWLLSNGVRVVLKPTDFQNDQILFSAYQEGGTGCLDTSHVYMLPMLGGLIGESGLGKFSKPDLEKKMAGKTASIRPYLSERYHGFQGSCTPNDLETMLQLINLNATSVRKDEEVFKSYIQRQRNVLQNLGVDPGFYFAEQTMNIKYNNNPRRKALPSAADLDRMDLQKMMDIYQSRFNNLKGLTCFFVGNIDLQKDKDMVLTYLGALPVNGAKTSYCPLDIPLRSGVIDSTFRKGSAPKARAENTLHGEFRNTPEERMAFTVLVEVLRIRLREAMRENLGGVYGVNVGSSLQYDPVSRYNINVTYTCEPGKVELLQQAMHQEIEKLIAEPITAEELSKVQELQLQARQKAVKENSYWLSSLSSIYQRTEDPATLTYEDYEKRVKDIAIPTIQAAAKTYLSGKNKMAFLLLPD